MDIRLKNIIIKGIPPFDEEGLIVEFMDGKNNGEGPDFFTIYGANGSGKTRLLEIMHELLYYLFKRDGDCLVKRDDNFYENFNNVLIRPFLNGWAMLNLDVIDDEGRSNPCSLFVTGDANVLGDNDFYENLENVYYGAIWDEEKEKFVKEEYGDLLFVNKDNFCINNHCNSPSRNLYVQSHYYNDSYFSKEVLAFVNESIRFMGKEVVFINEERESRSFVESESRERLFIKDNKGNIHRADTLSKGESVFIFFLFEIYGRLKETNIILIDTPEDGLHETFQIQLIDAIKKMAKGRNVQVVMATHSWVFIEECGHKGIRVLPDPEHMGFSVNKKI